MITYIYIYVATCKARCKALEDYLADVQGIIFLVDAADRTRFQEASEELGRLLEDPALAQVPLAVLGNKIDIPVAASEEELRHSLGLYTHMTSGKRVEKGMPKVRPLEVFMCSVVKRRSAPGAELFFQVFFQGPKRLLKCIEKALESIGKPCVDAFLRHGIRRGLRLVGRAGLSDSEQLVSIDLSAELRGNLNMACILIYIYMFIIDYLIYYIIDRSIYMSVLNPYMNAVDACEALRFVQLGRHSFTAAMNLRFQST